MKIFIKTLTGKNIPIIVKQTDTIGDIKEIFFQKEKMPVEQQRLIYSGHQLVNDQTIKEFNNKYYPTKIETGTVLHIVLALRGGGSSFDFASMENMRNVKLVADGPAHLTITKKGLLLIGFCTNTSCSIFNDKFISCLGLGIFDAQNLNNYCICPICQLQSDHTAVGFYECDFSINGIKASNTIKNFSRSVNGCQMEDIKPGVQWTKLIINVVKKGVQFALTVGKVESVNDN